MIYKSRQRQDFKKKSLHCLEGIYQGFVRSGADKTEPLASEDGHHIHVADRIHVDVVQY